MFVIYVFVCMCMCVWLYMCFGALGMGIDEHFSLHVQSTDITMGFVTTDYTLGEDSPNVEVCIIVSDGNLGKAINVNVATVDGTATSEGFTFLWWLF